MQKNRGKQFCAVASLLITIFVVFYFWNTIYGFIAGEEKKKQRANDEFNSDDTLLAENMT